MYLSLLKFYEFFFFCLFFFSKKLAFIIIVVIIYLKFCFIRAFKTPPPLPSQKRKKSISRFIFIYVWVTCVANCQNEVQGLNQGYYYAAFWQRLRFYFLFPLILCVCFALIGLLEYFKNYIRLLFIWDTFKSNLIYFQFKMKNKLL